jgi:hypothetical protein
MPTSCRQQYFKFKTPETNKGGKLNAAVKSHHSTRSY